MEDHESQALTPVMQDKGLGALVLSFATILTDFVSKKFGVTIDPTLLGGFMLAAVMYIWQHKAKSKAIVLGEIARDTELEKARILATASKSPEDASAAMNSFLAFAKAAAAGKVPGVPPMPVPVPPASPEVP
jgi:hypothetical protein